MSREAISFGCDALFLILISVFVSSLYLFFSINGIPFFPGLTHMVRITDEWRIEKDLDTSGLGLIETLSWTWRGKGNKPTWSLGLFASAPARSERSTDRMRHQSVASFCLTAFCSLHLSPHPPTHPQLQTLSEQFVCSPWDYAAAIWCKRKVPITRCDNFRSESFGLLLMSLQRAVRTRTSDYYIEG
jgi:hypothetical protein